MLAGASSDRTSAAPICCYRREPVPSMERSALYSSAGIRGSRSTTVKTTPFKPREHPTDPDALPMARSLFGGYHLRCMLCTHPRPHMIPKSTHIHSRAGFAALLMLLLGLGGCGEATPACVPEAVPQTDTVFILQHGWHTDLAIPSHVLRGGMLTFRRIFPDLQVLVVGFGKRTFMMAPVTTSGDLLIGPFPGKGAILVVGLNGPPSLAYDDGLEASVVLAPGGAERLSDFIWQTLDTQNGNPVRIRNNLFSGSMFYATRVGYAGTYTCNTWTADALHTAGVPVNPLHVVFAGQMMVQVARISGGSCAIKNTP
jgi:hypothetical protein